MITNRIKRGGSGTLPNGAQGEPLFTTDTYDLYIGKGDGTNQRFQKYLTNPVTGTGTTNYLSKFTAASTIGNSLIYDNGTNVIIGSTTPSLTYTSEKLALVSNSNTYLEIRGTTQASLVLTQQTQAAANKPDVEIFNSGNFGIVIYNPTIVSSNYLMYYAADSLSNRSLSFQTEGSNRLILNQNGTIRLNAYTTNGFVKTTSSDGTLAIDTSVVTSASGSANQVAYFTGSNAIGGTSFLTLNLTADNGYLILTGGATYKNADIWLNRLSNSWENAIRFQTNSVTDWYVGSSAIGANNDFEIYNYGTSSNGFKISKSNNAVTLGGILSGTSATFSGDLAVDTNILYVDSTNNKVGIGTLTPRSTADVNGVLTVGDGNPPAINIYRNVALGNNASFGSINFGGRYDATNYGIGASIYTNTVGAWSSTNYGGNLIFATTPQNSTTLTERFRIASTGAATFNGDLIVDTNTLYVNSTTNRVGISNLSPSYKLDLTSLGYGIQHYGDANNYLRTYAGSNFQIIESNGTNQFGYNNGSFFIQTSSTNRLTIASSGSSTFSSSITAATAIARGVNITSTLVAAANNDVLVGLDIAPTFTNGAFTGVSNIALRVNGLLTATIANFNGFGINSNPTSLGTSQSFVRFLNTGGDFYVGLESSTNGGFFTGSTAYDSVLYSTTSLNFIISNVSRLRITTTGATFSSSVTATGESFITGSDGGGKMLKFTGGTTKFNWMIAAQQNINNGLEITPSSAAGGSTFSTPAIVITSGGNVGINASDPVKTLDVRGTLAISNSAASYWYMDRDDSDGRFKILTDANSEKFSIATSGAATFSSSVTAASEFQALNAYGFKSYIGSSATGNNIVFTASYYVGWDGIYQSAGSTNDFGIWTNGGTNTQAKFVIKNGGSVGIGTSSPITTLQVTNTSSYSAPATTGNATGHFTVGKLTDSGLAIGSFRGAGTSGYTWFQAQILDAAQYTNNIVLQPNGGNVGINTTQELGQLNVKRSASGSTARALALYNNIANTVDTGVAIEFYPNSSDNDRCARISSVQSTSGNYADLRFFTSNDAAPVERMRITSGGEVWIGYTADQGAYILQANGAVQAASGFFDTSDVRLKNILNTIESSNISAINYTWKDGRNNKKHWGYAAQDVMKILPDAVEGSEDKFYTVNYNEVHTWKIAMLENRIKELEAKLK